MIEDIEGATSEPTRRRQVVVLSGVAAIASLVLLFSWVAPPELLMTRQAASPAPSATAGSAMWIVTGPTTFLQTRPSVWAPPAVNVKLMSECSDGAQINPPYYLVFEGNGQVMTVPLDARTAPSPLLTPSPLLISVDRASRTWAELVSLTVSCATPTSRIPRMDRRR